MGQKISEWRLKFKESVSKGLDKIKAKTEGARAGMGKLQGSAGKVTGKLGGLKGMASGVTSGLGSMGSGLMAMVSPAGLATAAVAALVAGLVHLTSVSSEFKALNRDVALSYGITGDAALATTAKTQAMAKTFGEDSSRITQGVKAVSKAFGVDAVTALDKYQQAVFAGADTNGELLDSMKEYPKLAKEAGLSMDQFFGIMTQSSNLGVYSDKGIDAIKEANLSLREMTPAAKAALKGIGLSGDVIQRQLTSGTKSVFDVIQDVSKAMGKVDGTARQTAIADIFKGAGEDAGTEFLLALNGMELGVEKLASKNEGVNASLQRQLTLNQAIATEQSKFAGEFGSLSEMWTNALGTLQLWGYRIVNFFIDLYDNSVLFRDVIDGTVSALTYQFKVLQIGFAAAYDGLQFMLRAFGFGGKNPFATFFGYLEDTWITAKVIFGRIVQIVQASGKVIGDVMSGNFRKAAANSADVITKIQRIASASTQEEVARIRGKAAPKAAALAGKPKSDTAPVTTSATPSATPGRRSGSGLTQGIAAVSGGGKQVRNVNVNIEKLVEQITIEQNGAQASEDELTEMVQRALIRAVQGAEQTLDS